MKCSICTLPYEGRGHSADPINDGRCCDGCHPLIILMRHHGSTGKPKPFKDICYDMWEKGMEFEREATEKWLNQQARLYPKTADLVETLAAGIHAALQHRKNKC